MKETLVFKRILMNRREGSVEAKEERRECSREQKK